jgi:hypothetical protein
MNVDWLISKSDWVVTVDNLTANLCSRFSIGIFESWGSGLLSDVSDDARETAGNLAMGAHGPIASPTRTTHNAANAGRK